MRKAPDKLAKPPVRPPTPLKAQRLLRGWTTEQVTNLTGVSVSTLNRYESGGAEPPLATARRFAELYETTVEALWPTEAAA